MIQSIWYLLIMVTNLSAPHANEFTMKVVKEGRTETYHIYNLQSNIWVVDWPDRKDQSKTLPLNFRIDQKHALRTLLDGSADSISLKAVCNLSDVKWKIIDEIKPHDQLVLEGWTPFVISRKENGLSLSQKNGIFQDYTEISVEWLPKD
jgi:hypothetical protein